MSNERRYKVGYAKPPQHSQFRPGQSGNPRGRRRRQPRGLDDLIRQELLSHVKVQVGGKQQSLSNLEIIVKRIVAQAVKGEPRAWKMLLNTQGFRAAAENPADRPWNSEEKKFLDAVREEAKEFQAMYGKPPVGKSSPDNGDSF